MLEKETTGGSGGSESEKNFGAEYHPTSVENLLSGQSSPEQTESTYDSLQEATKVTEENHYDSLLQRSLQPRFVIQPI